MNTQQHTPIVGARILADQVREVYVNGRLEHRLIESFDRTTGLRQPALNVGETCYHTLNGKCYILRAA